MQPSSAMTLADALYPRTGVRQWDLVRDAVLVIGFAGFVAVFAQIAFRVPFSPVPITGQTFGVLMTGGVLGAWRGATSLFLYMLVGMAGVPVFAPNFNLEATGKVAHFVLPWSGTSALPWDLTSGGYIVGFVLAAWLVGVLAQKGWDRKPWLLLAFLLGSVVLYVPGLLWLHYLIASGWVHPAAQQPLAALIPGQGDWGKALVGGLYPYIPGDLVKLYLASVLMPSAWALVGRRRG